MDNTKVHELFSKFPKVSLGFYPTPLHKLETLSQETGVNLYIKREDFSGVSLFGGNKIRKLEDILGAAKAAGAEYAFTYGATQSNHAMETAGACCRCGVKPVLFLYALIDPSEEDLRGNMLLDRLYGAEIHITSRREGESVEELKKRNAATGEAYRQQLIQQGHICWDIPVGGATELGSVGFVEGFIELESQMAALGLHADYLFHATGSGGTLAGLQAARALLGSDTEIISINVNKKGPDYLDDIVRLANGTLSLLGAPDGLRVQREDLHIDPGYYLPGYEQPNEASNEAIRILARKEGLVVDPVYTGKGLAGMLDYLHTGKIPKGSTAVFLHTGGAAALFAEKELLGDLLKA